MAGPPGIAHEEFVTDTEEMEKRRGGGGRRAAGAAGQVLGVGLLSLGLLNSMLTMKAGLSPEAFNYALLASGAVLLAFGLIGRGRKM